MPWIHGATWLPHPSPTLQARLRVFGDWIYLCNKISQSHVGCIASTGLIKMVLPPCWCLGTLVVEGRKALCSPFMGFGGHATQC